MRKEVGHVGLIVWLIVMVCFGGGGFREGGREEEHISEYAPPLEGVGGGA